MLKKEKRIRIVKLEKALRNKNIKFHRFGNASGRSRDVEIYGERERERERERGVGVGRKREGGGEKIS